MAKRSSDSFISKQGLDEPLVISSDVPYNQIEQTRVNVVNIFPAKLIYTGLVTGEPYEWSGPGSIVSVNSEDLADLLSKKIGESSCCGSSSKGNPLFEVV